MIRVDPCQGIYPNSHRLPGNTTPPNQATVRPIVSPSHRVRMASCRVVSPTACHTRAWQYKLRYTVGFGLVEMAISTNPKPTIYRNLYENTGPGKLDPQTFVDLSVMDHQGYFRVSPPIVTQPFANSHQSRHVALPQRSKLCMRLINRICQRHSAPLVISDVTYVRVILYRQSRERHLYAKLRREFLFLFLSCSEWCFLVIFRVNLL